VGSQFAVIDVETTGVGNKDRIVEIAIVVLDEQLNIIDEYDTLVDPMRDVGPVNIHGISPSMLANAPTFDEVAAAVRERVHGRVIVAHNLPFDRRIVKNEYARLHADLIPGTGICTLKGTGERLSLACDRYGIDLISHHRALADARATAQLLQAIFEEEETESARIDNLTQPLNPRTLRREANLSEEVPFLPRIISSIRYPTSDGMLMCYLDALDWVLDDLIITPDERIHLIELASELGLKPAAIADANRRYLASMINAAWRDGTITAEENQIIKKVADLLDVKEFDIPEVTEVSVRPVSFALGVRVCFTGTALDQNGNKISRGRLESVAANAGLQPVSSVTKKACDLLVASDPASQSGKAAKARKFDIPVVSVSEFLEKVGDV